MLTAGIVDAGITGNTNNWLSVTALNQDEWQSFQEAIRHVVPMFFAYAILGAVMSVCRFFKDHFRQEPFHASKLTLGILRDIAWTVALMCGAFWLSRGSHYFCLCIVLMCGLHGYKWTSRLVDSAVYKYFGVERRRNNRGRKNGN